MTETLQRDELGTENRSNLGRHRLITSNVVGGIQNESAAVRPHPSRQLARAFGIAER